MHALRRLIAAALVVPAAAVLAAGPASSAPALNAQDRRFLQTVEMGGAFEVLAGRLATTHTTNPATRAFGSRMVADHSKANAHLLAIAKAVGGPRMGRPDPAGTKTLMLWRGLRGRTFACAYLPQQVADHKATIGLFELEVLAGANGQVKAFAAATMPVLQQHLAQAQMALQSLPGC